MRKLFDAIDDFKERAYDLSREGVSIQLISKFFNELRINLDDILYIECSAKVFGEIINDESVWGIRKLKLVDSFLNSVVDGMAMKLWKDRNGHNKSFGV